MDEKKTENKQENGTALTEGRISSRFRNINTALFATAFLVMILAMIAVFNGIIRQVSADYIKHYATSSAEALSAHINREIGLIATASQSPAVISWLSDEFGNGIANGSGESEHTVKRHAFEELSAIVHQLYSNNLYVGFKESLNEYMVSEHITPESLDAIDTLRRDDPDDLWFFECLKSEDDYVIDVGIDRVLQKKRVWLDYKIQKDGETLGVICTGLEFSHLAYELFANADDINMRSLVIDRNGSITMDSDLLDDHDFLNNDFDAHIEDISSDKSFLSALTAHTGSTGLYLGAHGATEVIRVSAGQYSFMTIAPIRYTDWAVVVLYDTSSLISMSSFVPVLSITLILLLVFTLATNTAIYRLIFSPLERLIRSLTQLKENNNEHIYGIDRNDEFGALSNTIYDLFTMANYDVLTGIYNRRFMENNLQRIVGLLSRSGGVLSQLMVDVDFFKAYNDTYGHEKGDVCLRSVATALTAGIDRKEDFVARYGGEEFVVVLPNTNETGARMIAEKLLKNVSDLNIRHSSSSVAPYVTVSIGVSTASVEFTWGWEDYLKRADEALYVSKQSGRNRYTYLDFTPPE